MVLTGMFYQLFCLENGLNSYGKPGLGVDYINLSCMISVIRGLGVRAQSIMINEFVSTHLVKQLAVPGGGWVLLTPLF